MNSLSLQITHTHLLQWNVEHFIQQNKDGPETEANHFAHTHTHRGHKINMNVTTSPNQRCRRYHTAGLAAQNYYESANIIQMVCVSNKRNMMKNVWPNYSHGWLFGRLKTQGITRRLIHSSLASHVHSLQCVGLLAQNSSPAYNLLWKSVDPKLWLRRRSH